MIYIPAITASPNITSDHLGNFRFSKGFNKAVNNATDEKQLIAMETLEAFLAEHNLEFNERPSRSFYQPYRRSL